MTNLAALQSLQRSLNRLRTAEQALDVADLKQQKEGTIMVEPKVAQIIQQLDEASNGIAARIQRLIDQGGVTPDSVAALQAEVVKLQSLGADPSNPIPASVSGSAGSGSSIGAGGSTGSASGTGTQTAGNASSGSSGGGGNQTE